MTIKGYLSMLWCSDGPPLAKCRFPHPHASSVDRIHIVSRFSSIQLFKYNHLNASFSLSSLLTVEEHSLVFFCCSPSGTEFYRLSALQCPAQHQIINLQTCAPTVDYTATKVHYISSLDFTRQQLIECFFVDHTVVLGKL